LKGIPKGFPQTKAGVRFPGRTGEKKYRILATIRFLFLLEKRLAEEERKKKLEKKKSGQTHPDNNT